MLYAFCGEGGIALPIDHHYEWYSFKQTQVRDRYVKSSFVLIPSQHCAKRGKNQSINDEKRFGKQQQLWSKCKSFILGLLWARKPKVIFLLLLIQSTSP